MANRMNKNYSESPGQKYGPQGLVDWGRSVNTADAKGPFTRYDTRYMIMWRNWNHTQPNFRNCLPTLQEAIDKAMLYPDWEPDHIIDRINNQIVHVF